MTRVEFFFNVEDKLQKIAELSESVVSKGRRLMLFSADTQLLARVEDYLWSHPPTGFTPHCRCNHALAAVTPIVIDSHGDRLAHDDVLINLQDKHPPFFSRFRRLIEIVGLDEADKSAARERYRFYRDRGYEIKSFDVSGAAI
ncbi:MAG TPA: DNA polymerase III subunit chi [Methylophilaceae bacterium]|nr:DNA polymerase III subunit chi [Methylophilaceae bacterium]